MNDPLSCPDPLAERRYAYAAAAANDEDWTAAAEMFAQALELAPSFAPAWLGLGEAREALGEREPAIAAYEEALGLDTKDRLGATARLMRLGAWSGEARLPEAFVARLFDDYADRYDGHLLDNLSYRGPKLILDALDEVDPGRAYAVVVDLGCGTGLVGLLLRSRAARLTGVDLSTKMAARANARGVYDAVIVAEALRYLDGAEDLSLDCLVAADVLAYFGDLRPLFKAAARLLKLDGRFVFTVEAGDDAAGYALGPSLRFLHSAAHVESAAATAGLRVALCRAASARRERGAEAPGLAVVLARGA